VNVLQTLLFISFGVVAFTAIGKHLEGGSPEPFRSCWTPTSRRKSALPSRKQRPATLPRRNLLRRRLLQQPQRLRSPDGAAGHAAQSRAHPWQVFLSFILIPLSSIMFPHM